MDGVNLIYRLKKQVEESMYQHIISETKLEGKFAP